MTTLLENLRQLDGKDFIQYFLVNHIRTKFFTKVISVKKKKSSCILNVIYSEDNITFDDTMYPLSAEQLIADHILGDIIFEN